MPRKQRVDKKREPLPLTGDGLKSVHIQCRLNPNLSEDGSPREYNAYEVYAHYYNAGQDDRWIVREALIAMGQMVNAGWQPIEVVNSATLSAAAIQAVEQLGRLTPVVTDFQQLVQQLLTMDFSSMRHADGSQVDAAAVTKKLTQFERSATDMLGQAFIFDVDE